MSDTVLSTNDAAGGFSDDDEGPRTFKVKAPKNNKFWIQLGTMIVGMVVLAMIGTTGWMYFGGKQSEKTLPELPAIDVAPEPEAAKAQVPANEPPKVVEATPVLQAPAAVIEPPVAPVAEEPKVVVVETVVAAPEPVAPTPAPEPVKVEPVKVEPVKVEPVPMKDSRSANVSDDKFNALEKTVRQLRAEIKDSNKTIANLESRVTATPKPVAAKSAPSNMTLTIVSIDSNKVEAIFGGKNYVVTTGGLLPGGAAFLGYDASKNMMKTSRGDFLIN